MQTSATGSAHARVIAPSGVQRGFTLAELLVVLAILSIVAALLPWTLSRALPQRRLDAAAEILVTELRLAHAKAAMTGQPLEFQVANATDRHGRPRSSLVLYPDGSASGGRIELRDGANRRVVVVSELTGRVWIEREGARDGR
jgi:general secretion pathway protein H